MTNEPQPGQQPLDGRSTVAITNPPPLASNDVYLLDYKTEPKVKTILIKDFKAHKFQGTTTTDKTEKDSNDNFNIWIKNIFTDREKDLNFDWFVLNQNEVYLKY